MTTTIPNYALYGHEAQPAWLGMVHFEWIHERSSLHNYDIEPHFHDGLIQLLYVTSGGGTVFIDGTSWPVHPQTLIVIPARHVHGFRFTPDIDGPVVTAAQRPLESIAEVAAPELLEHIRRPLVLGVSESERHVDALMPLFDAIQRETRVHASGEVAAGTALLMVVFVQIARLATSLNAHEDAGSARSRKTAQVERFRALVDARFREHLPVEDYAAQLGLTAGHLSRLCREVLGISSLDVINARVVHEAERELVYSILGIKQIAGLLGFSDDAYFGRFFRKQTGRTPTEFREAARLRLAPEKPAQRRRQQAASG
jgi:AraC family transcriptional regulator, transcriptional activator of pobA